MATDRSPGKMGQAPGIHDPEPVPFVRGRRVVSPYPVTLEDGRALIRARKGLRYQILIDGTRIVDVESQGEDVIPIDAP